MLMLSLTVQDTIESLQLRKRFQIFSILSKISRFLKIFQGFYKYIYTFSNATRLILCIDVI